MTPRQKKSNPSSGMPVEPKRIRATLRSIMGWTTGDYARHMGAIPLTERQSFLEGYGDICAVMRDEYGQWASNLLLQANTIGDKSNLLAAYALDTAPEQVQQLSCLRLLFLEQVYDKLSKEEKADYGWLLHPGYLNSGCMPDIQAAQVMYLLHFKNIANHMDLQTTHPILAQINSIKPIPGFVENPPPDYLADMAYRNTMALLYNAKSRVPGSQTDSLYAKVLLNTSINRFLSEETEQLRLKQQAAAGLRTLVKQLQSIYGDELGFPLDDQGIEDAVRNLLNAQGEFPAVSPTAEEVALVMRRAEVVADLNSIKYANPDALDYQTTYKFLAALCIAWSLCTREKHDNRIVGIKHRKHHVIGGSASEFGGKPRPSIMSYHRAQTSLMWTSRQLRKLSVESLDRYLGTRIQTNEWWKGHILPELRIFTLAQWAELTRLVGVEDLDVKAFIAERDRQHDAFEQELGKRQNDERYRGGFGYPGFGVEIREATIRLLKDNGITDDEIRQWDADLLAKRGTNQKNV
jgi:hypothetical protein